MTILFSRYYKKLKLLAVAPLLISVLFGCKASKDLPVEPSVDLQRYTGTWYEISKLPNRFQKQCIANTQAQYSMESGAIKVVNSCLTARGNTDSRTGVAKVVEGSNNAKLRVSFFQPIYGDYWILKLDPNYQWVLVGEPSRQYAWILSRQKTLDASTTEKILAYAQEQGFERSQFVATEQQ